MNFNDGIIKVKENDNWEIKTRKDMNKVIVENMKKKINIIFNIMNKSKDKELIRKARRMKINYNTYIKFEF